MRLQPMRLPRKNRARSFLGTALTPLSGATANERCVSGGAGCSLGGGCGIAAGAGGIEVNERRINVVDRSDGVLWATFPELCETPRSAADYIEIAREYHTVLLSGVPVLDARNDNAVRRFINLVDEFYDRRVKLIISAEAEIDRIYEGGRLNFEIERTRSRLLEMQSTQYLAAEHLP